MVRVTVEAVPVIETGTNVCEGHVGQSVVTVTEGTVPTVISGQVGQRLVTVTLGQPGQ